MRCYRSSLDVLARAVDQWNEEAAQDGVNFETVMQLGDLIDGQNNGTYGAGLDFTKPQTESAWGAVSEVRITLLGEDDKLMVPLLPPAGDVCQNGSCVPALSVLLVSLVSLIRLSFPKPSTIPSVVQ